MKIRLTAPLCVLLAGTFTSCIGHAHGDDAHGAQPPPGSNQMLRAPIMAADGLEVIISDVVIPAGVTVPRHYHPGEEFLYVIEGSAVHVEEGKADRILSAGDAYVIPPRAVHAPRGGPEGGRAIVFRVHVADQPERVLVPAPADADDQASPQAD
ncbi:MAG TPA: cupin domain-containing protein [Pseudomonadales bacterium]|nr:cupin domain-containing protein [Pseudomonadales bacterium]